MSGMTSEIAHEQASFDIEAQGTRKREIPASARVSPRFPIANRLCRRSIFDPYTVDCEPAP